jgi:sulfatase modifying factor 1
MASWQGVLGRPEVERVVRAPVMVQYRPELVLVPGGKFRMGSSAAERAAFARELPEALRTDMEDEHEHDAEVAPLYVCRTEVTRAQWRAVMDAVPAECVNGCEDEHPVSNIDWNEACHYMVELTRRENEARTKGGVPALTDCYAWDGATCAWTDPACTGFRLPTETEWEYVARAGTTTAYSFGDDPKDMCKFGNGADTSAKARHPERDKPAEYGPMFDCDDRQVEIARVKSYGANPWGLHDMHGNILEWVWDWYSAELPDNAGGLGYTGPTSGADRVLRGGSFRDWPRGLRAAVRRRVEPANRDQYFGLRCVRSAPLEALEATEQNRLEQEKQDLDNRLNNVTDAAEKQRLLGITDAAEKQRLLAEKAALDAQIAENAKKRGRSKPKSGITVKKTVEDPLDGL